MSTGPSPSSTIPTAVIWDMGGIMYQFFTELMVDVGRAQDWPLEHMPMGPTGPAPDPHYEAMDRGEFGEPEYVKRLAAVLAKEDIAFSPYRDIDFSNGDRPQTWAAIERLQVAGFQQVVLTNDATRWLGERWWETWVYRRFFAAIVDVKTIGIRKPAPEPYLACVRALSISPEECLFIDDMHVNCIGAEAVGMQSYWFDVTDPDGSLAQLMSRLKL
jgi:FMN phosphatase YigB (HAD superfamily)